MPLYAIPPYQIGFKDGFDYVSICKLALMGRMARWLLILVEFDLKFHTRKSVKRRAVVKFLADFLVQEEEDQEYKFPNEELMQTTKET